MDYLLGMINYWLPLIQGFAALASIAGALLSWRYALKAQRARNQMTRNMVASRILSMFEATQNQLRELRGQLLNADGQPDVVAYRSKQNDLKHIFETLVAGASAATPYLQEHIAGWELMINAFGHASVSPMPGNVEAAAKHLMLTTERIKISATTREIQPDA